MGIWPLRPIVGSMDCCSPNGSGSVAMGKLWPISDVFCCTNLQKFWKRRTAHLCKTFRSLETNPEFRFQMWARGAWTRELNHWITDVQLIATWLSLEFPRAKCIQMPRSDMQSLFGIEVDKNQKQNPYVQHLVTKQGLKVKPGNKLLQITVSKWQHPNYCQSRFWAVHRSFIILVTGNRLSSLPLVSARRSTPAARTMRFVQLWSLGLSSTIWTRSCKKGIDGTNNYHCML